MSFVKQRRRLGEKLRHTLLYKKGGMQALYKGARVSTGKSVSGCYSPVDPWAEWWTAGPVEVNRR